MKSIKIKQSLSKMKFLAWYGSFILTVAVFSGACHKEYLEAYTNPNRPEIANISSYAASALYYTFSGSRIMNWNSANLIYANSYAHQYTHGGISSWFNNVNSYANGNSGWTNTAFRSLANTNGQIRILWDRAIAENDKASEEIAKTLFIYNTSMWSKVFGDVPFDDIYVNDGLNQVPTSPIYQPQLYVFRRMLDELGMIRDSLSGFSGTASVGDGDFLYKGNVKKWAKFVNTLRLRLALDAREAFKKEGAYDVDFVIRDCVANPLIEIEDDEAAFVRGNNPEVTSNLDGGIEDVVFGFPSANVGIGPMQDMVDYLQDAQNVTKTDPRLNVWCTPPKSLHRVVSASGDRVVEVDATKTPSVLMGYPNPDNIHQGVSFAVSYTPLLVPGENVSAFTDVVLGKSLTEAPKTRIFTLGESLLLQAEAAVRGITSGNVKDLYEQGIKAGMKSWGVTDAAANAYISNGKNAVATPDVTNVMRELWMAYFTNNWQAWTLLKRTKFEELGAPLGFKGPREYRLSQNLVMPSRFPYPDAEKKINSNALEAANRIGGDQYTSLMDIDIRKVDPSQVGKF